MPIPFASEAWLMALQDEINRSEPYRAAAKNWEGDFYFVVSADRVSPAVYLYVDLWHGECRAAYVAEKSNSYVPEFVIEAPLATWQKVVQKKLDPIQGLVTRQLKLRGPLGKVLRAPLAAMLLVQCCTRIETQWPAAGQPLAPPKPLEA
jgi:putative sterol carrier protein